MKEEINIMSERCVWELVPWPEKEKIIGNRWVYTIKRNEKRKILRLLLKDTDNDIPHQHAQGSVTAVWYHNEVLEPIVRFYAAAVGLTFVLMDNNARPHRADIVDDYLESEGITCFQTNKNADESDSSDDSSDSEKEKTVRLQIKTTSYYTMSRAPQNSRVGKGSSSSSSSDSSDSEEEGTQETPLNLGKTAPTRTPFLNPVKPVKNLPAPKIFQNTSKDSSDSSDSEDDEPSTPNKTVPSKVQSRNISSSKKPAQIPNKTNTKSSSDSSDSSSEEESKPKSKLQARSNTSFQKVASNKVQLSKKNSSDSSSDSEDNSKKTPLSVTTPAKTAAKGSLKGNIIAKEDSSSDSSDSEEDTPGAKNQQKVHAADTSDSSDSEEETAPNNKTLQQNKISAAKPIKAPPVSKPSDSSDSEDDSSSDEEQTKNNVAGKTKISQQKATSKLPVHANVKTALSKKTETSSESSDSDNNTSSKPKTPQVKVVPFPVKQVVLRIPVLIQKMKK
ncbi:histone-lysine N-methyltransferase SETMAR [Trichonephila clavipes]|nr:histone-lysine N-methyltransferase SETMAR [Trichonephila clavipes]